MYRLLLVVPAVLLIGFSTSTASNGEEKDKTSGAGSICVLKDVPRIGFDIQCSPFPGSLFSYLQYTGDPQPYDYLMGVTGAAFRRLWNRDDGGNIDLSYLSPEHYKRIFETLGYGYRVISPRNRDEMIKALKESIAKGRPVLASGIIGPPEYGLITGYEQDGEVLRGYSYFQDSNIKGYYAQADWYKKASWAGDDGFIIVGEKKARPSQRDVLISSLKWAIDLERTEQRPGCPNHISGLAAYTAWANALEVDADYPKDNQEMMGTRVMDSRTPPRAGV